MKKLAVLLAVLIIAALLVSCGSKGNDTSDETPDAPHYSDGGESGGDIGGNSGTDSSETSGTGSSETSGSEKEKSDDETKNDGSSSKDTDIYEDPSSWTKPF